MKPLLPFVLFAAAAPAAVFCQTGSDYYGPRPLWERVEIALTAGYGQSLADWTSVHLTQAVTPAGFRVSAQNRLQMSAGGALTGGASATFFFRSGLVLQGGFGYLKTGVTNETPFQYQYNRPPAVWRSETFEGSGELTTVPIFINIVNNFNLFRGPANRRLRGYLSLGPALFFNSIVVDAFAGAAAAVSTGGGDELADAFKVPVVVEDTTWVSLGGNIGLSFDFHFSRSLALTAEGRFFYAPKRNLVWRWQAGTVSGLSGQIPAYEFTSAAAANYMADTTAIALKPSFFHFSAGVKVIF